MAQALKVPLYRLFTNDEQVKKPNIPTEFVPSRAVRSKQDQELRALAKLLFRMNDKDRGILLHMASKMANRA
jgi:hypothetical protein